MADVAEVLNTSVKQVYALVRRGELPAIKIGGRGQWRVESDRLEEYIEQQYSDTRDYISAHPWGDSDEPQLAGFADEDAGALDER